MSLLHLSDRPGELNKKTSHERLDGAKELLEAGGLEVPGVSAFLLVWRKFGFKGLLFLILFVGFPIGQYSALRYAVYSGLPRMVGGFGLEFEAEEWSLAPFAMRATARNVRMSGSSMDRPVLTAGEIEFHGSAWTILRGLPDMLTFHVFGGTQPFNEIVVRHGELHLERSLTGHMNWSDFVASVPAGRFEDAISGVYRVNELRFEDFRVTYVESVPGGSADGLIRTAQTQVKVDEVRGTITDMAPPRQFGERPTRFKLNGRSADGLFELSGSAALFLPEGTTLPADENIRRVSLTPGGQAVYPYEVSVYLENIAAAAYGRMVPVSTIVPINGIIAGTTTIVRTGARPECKGAFKMTAVRFAPNPLVVTEPSDVEIVRQVVADTVYTGPFQLCDTQLLDATAERPAATVLTSLTQQATVDAPPAMKALVDRDRRVIGGEQVETTLDSLTASLAQDMGRRVATSIGGKTGQIVGQSLARGGTTSTNVTPTGAGRAVVGGVKSVGSGIKRLFGGGSKDSDKKTGK
ncbi:MAG: hypothetical protein ABMA15_27230 [Vicinamibacterales bacterium]